MDKIAKALLKLSSKEKELIKTILLKIKSDSLAALDVKKLKGHSDIFRVRHGKIRLIFQRNKAEVEKVQSHLKYRCGKRIFL